MLSRLGGHYKIVSALGRGGFGETYLAEDEHATQQPQCVIKQLKPQDKSCQVLETARRLFAAEASVLQRIGNHPQIPQLLDYFEENQEFYLVQEFIEGEDLSQVLGAKLLSEAEVIGLMQEILQILDFVHQQNVIHRDVNPRNLIRRKQDKKLVLIDFGAVKQINTQLISPQEQPSSLTIGIGTPGYTPSEQAQGKPKLSSDIYAVGMLAIHALTGISPQKLPEDPQTGEIVWRTQDEVSSRFAQILDQMVCYDFRARYQSAAAVLSDLERLSDTWLSATQFQALTRVQSRAFRLRAKSWVVLAPLAIAGMSLGLPKLLPARQNQPLSTPTSIIQPTPGATPGATPGVTQPITATSKPVTSSNPSPVSTSSQNPPSSKSTSPQPVPSKPAPLKTAPVASPPTRPAATKPVARKLPVPAPPVGIPQPRPAQRPQVAKPPATSSVPTQVISQPSVVQPVTKVMIRINPKPPAAAIKPPAQIKQIEKPIFQAPPAKPKPQKAPKPAKGGGKGQKGGKSKGKGKR